jgi:hypothetical protein
VFFVKSFVTFTVKKLTAKNAKVAQSAPSLDKPVYEVEENNY